MFVLRSLRFLRGVYRLVPRVMPSAVVSVPSAGGVREPQMGGAVFSAEGYQVRAHSWLRLQPQLRELLPPLQKCKAFIVARAVVLYVLSAARKCERMAAGI